MINKAPLMMMEQLIMTLVFALAAALCLRCFAWANQMRNRTERQDEAVMIAQNTVEMLKAGRYSAEGDEYPGYSVEVSERAGDVDGLVLADVGVYFEGEMLFSLTTGWQEAEE